MSLNSFNRLYRILRMNIFAFAKAAGWPDPTPQQREVLADINRACVNDVPYFGCVKSGQGVGKTNLEALVAAWRAFRSYGAPSFVTAPTMRQCRDVFLKELRLNLEKADPTIKAMFDVRATRAVIMGKKDWGVITMTATKAEDFQGIHHDYMSVIVDEGSGMEREIFEAIFGTLTNRDRLFLTCGNPNTRDCAFFDFFGISSETFTNLYTMSSIDSPIVSQENVRRMADLYGTDSDMFRVRVLGEFPLQDPNCVMNSDDLYACTKVSMVDAAAKQEFLKHMHPEMKMKQMGIDFARYGSDKSVIYRRSGLAVVEQAHFDHTEPDVVVAKAFEMAHRAKWPREETFYVADADGMGQGIMHAFHRRNALVTEFHNGGTARQSSQYYDRITEAMFELAALVKARACHIPNDNTLIRDLSTRQYAMAGGKLGKGRLKIESKEIYTKRTGESSPDRGDAACMTYYPFAHGRAKVASRGTKRRRR